MADWGGGEPDLMMGGDIPWNNAQNSNPTQQHLPTHTPMQGDGGLHQRHSGSIGESQGGGNPLNPMNAFFSTGGSENAIANAGMAYGKNFISKNMGGWLSFWNSPQLKYYFQVDNAYVVKKLKVLVCPLLHSNWNREVDYDHSSPSGAVAYQPPRLDVNSPDLYIPIMAFVTFVLLMGYTLGVYGEFNPEIIGVTASSTFATLFIEVMLLKFGFSFLGAETSPSFLEFTAYSSYKYVGLVVDILSAHLFGYYMFWVTLLVMSCMSSVFLLRTLSRVMTFPDGDPIRKKYFLLVIGFLQIVVCVFLVRPAAPSGLSDAGMAAAAAAQALSERQAPSS